MNYSKKVDTKRMQEMTKEDWQELINISTSYSDMLRRLYKRDDRGGYHTMKKCLEKFPDLDYTKLKENQRIANMEKKHYTLEDIFSDHSPVSSSAIKDYLKKFNLKDLSKCEKCGITEWNGKPIHMQLHHIDGNHFNNELSNLQVLCPNCHSQTDSYAKSKQKAGDVRNEYGEDVVIVDKTHYCIDCGKEISSKAIRCSACDIKFRLQEGSKDRQEGGCFYSKIPSKEQLEKDVAELHTKVAIGKKYDVKAGTVSKWMRKLDVKSYIAPKVYKPKVYNKEYQVYGLRKTATGWELFLHAPQHKFSRKLDWEPKELEQYIQNYYDEAIKQGIVKRYDISD